MSEKRHCPSCGREFDTSYQFCPFDATPLGRKCPTCGKAWAESYQFCPLDSTALLSPAEPPAEVAEVEIQPTPAPEPQPEPAPPPPPPLTFIEQAAKSDWRSAVFRPATIIFIIGAVLVGAAVYYLDWRTRGPDLPLPTASYSLLPNEGKTKGLPVAIKVNQVTVFMIDDPMETGTAARAQELANTLTQTFQKAKEEADVRFAVDFVGGRPVILEVNQSGPAKQTLAMVTEGDATLAGETDAGRLAARWAERLTDAVRVFVFGQPPTFSTGTEFGNALAAMYKAALAPHGRVTKRSLETAFQQLSAEQRKALETPPLAPPSS